MCIKVSIFDSGSGGLTTLVEAQKLVPDAEYYYLSDREHCPYGDKSDDELLQLCINIVETLADWGANIIIIACNTATTRCIGKLRQLFPEIIFIGTEPALKVAHDTSNGRTLLLSTTKTSQSPTVVQLATEYFDADNLEILPCPGLADIIEDSLRHPEAIKLQPYQYLPTDFLSLNQYGTVQCQLQTILDILPSKRAFDNIVLGCTHYIIIHHQIQTFFPCAKLIHGNYGVARRLKQLTKQQNSSSKSETLL